MNAPVKLVTSNPTADEEIRASAIQLLEEALADARSGKVVGVVILSKEIDGGWYHRATASLSLRERIGSLELVKFDLMKDE
jgi:1,4-dihydroxy-2-naphthoyl-CoA synthase